MICFDTTPLIWAVQGAGPKVTATEAGRAIAYVKHLRDRSIPILLPAPVVSEYLRKIDPRDHGKHERVIRRSFRVATFDGKAISIAARLESDRDKMKDLRRGHAISKGELSVDAQICAIAIAAGAKRVITHNPKHFRDLVGTEIEVSDVPVVEVQSELFTPVSRALLDSGQR